MVTDPAKARALILSQLEAFASFDEDDFSRGWCHCNVAFLEAGAEDPHCHVHRHVKTFRELFEASPGGKVEDWLKALEETWCICHKEYKRLEQQDPNCSVHLHARKIRLMVERALLGPHCKDCPGPYCPIDERPYVPDAPDPKWACSWATTGQWKGETDEQVSSE